VNDPGAQPPDWGTIFRRGRRRILARLTVLAAVATVGALLLLGGGLSAQGAVSWKIGGGGNKSEKTDATKEAKNPRDKNDGEGNSGRSATTEDERQRNEGDPEESIHPSHCKQVTSDSSAAGTEYGDWNGPSNAKGHRCRISVDPPVIEGDEGDVSEEEPPAPPVEATLQP
jgi:hypothetical protein